MMSFIKYDFISLRLKSLSSIVKQCINLIIKVFLIVSRIDKELCWREKMCTNFHFSKSRLINAILLVGLIITQSIYSQGTGSLRGRVFDKTTEEPLTGANIIVVQTSLGAASDIDGNYLIRGIPVGNRSIKVSYIGYNSITVNVEITANRTLEQDFYLDARTITGETVIITAQAEGQLSAINQQLTSNTISNVVSRSRIKELPDVNAAESIGRLPGISIQRSGGEATKIEIRGLSPKYNTVTVNGVRLPSTGGDDRSVDLSLISSNMLDGIIVKKANTPDMDADALGGTVDLRLREAPEKLDVNISLQAGYNKLQNYYGNYNFNGSVSNRFFNNDLGIIASINIDDYDRSADKLSADYMQTTQALTGITQTQITSLNLREENIKRGRTGASLLLDYKIPDGKITANTFFNRLKWDGLYRINRMQVRDNRHYYDLEDRGGTTSIFTGAFGAEQDFSWIKYDVGFSRTSSRANDPDQRTWTFVQENAAFNTAEVNPSTHPNQIPALATIKVDNTGLSSAYIYDTKLDENETTLQLNVQMPFRIWDQVNGFLKAGGKLRWLDRTYDQEQNGRDGLQYGGGSSVNNVLANTFKYLARTYPDQYNWFSDSSLARMHGLMPISRFMSSYNRSDFLNGEYPLGFSPELSMMNQFMDAVFATGENRNYSIGSIGRDYDGIERYQAAYLMAEINITKYATLIPGIRWEQDYSEYNGQRFREVTLNNIQGPPADLDSLTIERKNRFLLPMIHLIVSPTDWMKVRIARTETLTRPDYIQYAPITSINVYQSYIRAANSQLKPAQSTNYDASISIYENSIGLFTVSGFYKSIKDLIFQTSYIQQRDIPVFEGLNIPASWLQGAAPQVDTYINNPYKATYKGIELDWQTHFWYLPSILNGLILNINYTRINSEIDKQLYFNRLGDIIPGSRPPRRQNILVDSSRVARMPDQPAHILNVTLGYDYKDFSVRLSYLYQTDKVTYIDKDPVLDNFSGTYARWDLTFQQKLDWGLQIFANLTNLNNRADRNYRGSALVNPTYIEYYGFTMDIGVRYRL